MVKIKKQIVSQSLINSRSYGYGNSKKYIVIHETANTNRGANAQAHANLQSNGNSRQASWHYQVDDKQIIQSFPDSVRCWHAGSSYNHNSIGIEICVNSDGNFKKAVQNAAELTKYLMKKYNIPVSNVITHRAASGWKDCPRFLRNGSKGVTWNNFINMVKKSGGKVSSSSSSSKSKSKTNVKWVGTKDKGKELIVIAPRVNYYDTQRWTNPTGSKKKGYRWKIDNLYRVQGSLQYRVQDENRALFYTTARKDLVKVGGKYNRRSVKKTSGSRNVTNYKGNSIVDYLNLPGNKHLGGSSFKNRQRLAKKYGIKGYIGTSRQNIQLLNKLRNSNK